MITTTPCDDGNHEACQGRGLIQGILRPPHEPEHEGEKVWVTVRCGCRCHEYHPIERKLDLLDR